MAEMSTRELAAKFNSKSEYHWFLVQEMGAYLPRVSHVTVYHLRDLMAGKKKVSAADVTATDGDLYNDQATAQVMMDSTGSVDFLISHTLFVVDLEAERD